MTDEDFAPLAQGARALGLELTAEQVALFARFRHELLDWNQRVNLTAIAELADHRHPAGHINRREHEADDAERDRFGL